MQLEIILPNSLATLVLNHITTFLESSARAYAIDCRKYNYVLTERELWELSKFFYVFYNAELGILLLIKRDDVTVSDYSIVLRQDTVKLIVEY